MPPEESVESACRLAAGASRIVGFTGAGISTESGVPDFRSPHGVWAQNRIVDYQEFVSSEAGRIEYWRQKAAAWPAMRDAQPNAGHFAFVELHKQGRLDALITQNIERLHQRSGLPADKVLELHGTTTEAVCLTAAIASRRTRRAGASRAARRRRAAGSAAGSSSRRRSRSVRRCRTTSCCERRWRPRRATSCSPSAPRWWWNRPRRSRGWPGRPARASSSSTATRPRSTGSRTRWCGARSAPCCPSWCAGTGDEPPGTRNGSLRRAGICRWKPPMPELPEVETVRSTLAPVGRGPDHHGGFLRLAADLRRRPARDRGAAGRPAHRAHRALREIPAVPAPQRRARLAARDSPADDRQPARERRARQVHPGQHVPGRRDRGGIPGHPQVRPLAVVRAAAGAPGRAGSGTAGDWAR